MHIDKIDALFSEAQADLIERFKLKLKRAADDLIGEFYTDVTIHAVSDAHSNFRNYLRDELREEFKNEISSEYGHYSWAHLIRMDLLKHHAETLRNNIITDLEGKVESLQSQLDQLREYRR